MFSGEDNLLFWDIMVRFVFSEILPLYDGRTDQTLWASQMQGDKSRLNFLNLVVSIPFERWPFNKYYCCLVIVWGCLHVHALQEHQTSIAEQGWQNGEGSHISPMFPGFQFWIGCCMWVMFVVSLLCPLSPKTYHSSFFYLLIGEHE